MKTLQDLEVGDEVTVCSEYIQKIVRITKTKIFLEPNSNGYTPVYNRQTGRRVGDTDKWRPDYIRVTTDKDRIWFSLKHWREQARIKRNEYTFEVINTWTEYQCKLFVSYLNQFDKEKDNVTDT